jgi:CubicO group peptidase (beta-lactamase class C family)
MFMRSQRTAAQFDHIAHRADRGTLIPLSVLIGAIALGLAAVPAFGQGPSGAWPTATPASVGLNAAVLDSIDREITSGRYGNIDRFVVIRHGAVAYDKRYTHDYDAIYRDSVNVNGPLNEHDLTGPYNYYAPWWHPTYRRGELHTLQSVSKTVASVVIGTAVTRGDFPSLDTPILRFFDTTKVKNLDDRKRRITVRHVLTMTGGFEWNESLPYTDPKNSASGLEASNDWAQFTLDQPMAREPGTKWNYSSGESSLLAPIFRRATGVDIEEYAAKYLFAPLGITQWFWKRTPSGAIDTEGGLYLEAKDLARIWQLWLQHGRWNGTQVVSESWVTQSITPQIDISTQPNGPKYGFKWWLYPDATNPGKYIWSGSGFGGQFPMAYPDLDMVVVFNAWNILPGKPSLAGGAIRARLARAVTDAPGARRAP